MRKLTLGVALLLGACGGSSDPVPGTAGEEPVARIYQVARQCVTIQDADGRYVARNEAFYAANADSADDAERFFMQPTDLGSYMLLSAYERDAQPAVCS